LAAFQARYNVEFTRETFTRQQPNERGEFVLEPNSGDPLPPIGCMVKIHDYDGHTFNTVVIGVDEFAGTYTAAMV
jgi:hypothetical protein